MMNPLFRMQETQHLGGFECLVREGSFQNYETVLKSTTYFSLDPNEDPVSGLARVSSINSLQAVARRNDRRRWEQRRTQRQQSAVDENHILSEKFESLDYEIIENELYRDEEASKDHQVGVWECI